jgi:hypothetical protein
MKKYRVLTRDGRSSIVEASGLHVRSIESGDLFFLGENGQSIVFAVACGEWVSFNVID